MEQKSFSQFVCLSGLPRSGSTLVSSILSQNPKIHAEGNSAVCQLMWDMHVSFSGSSKEQITANSREKTVHDILSAIPHLYYKHSDQEIVVDKCRSWSLLPNIELLKKYVDTNIKIIILERPVIDVVKSFAKLYRKNGIHDEAKEMKLIQPDSEPIMRSLNGINYAKQHNEGNTFLFIQYDDIVKNTKKTIQKIYDFCGWEPFEHDFENIINKYPENDEAYGLKGMHSIRSSIKVEPTTLKLSGILTEKCREMDG